MIEYITNPAVLTLFGVLIGSALPLIGTILNQYLLSRKDAQQWAREQAAKSAERDLERQLKSSEEIETLYYQCLNCLSVYLSTAQLERSGVEIDLAATTKDIHNWLSKLVVKRPDERLLGTLDHFLSYPDEQQADRLRKYILEMVKKDAAVFMPKQSQDSKPDNSLDTKRKISFSIDKDFQKSLMIQGVELPNRFELIYSPQDILPTHREKLLEIYYATSRRIPDNAPLMLPRKNARATAFIYDKTWEAKLNPKEISLHGVLNAWVADFDKCAQEAQNSVNQTTNS